MMNKTICAAACALGLVLMASAPAWAQTIIDDWAAIKAPAPPSLKAVTIEAASTALLILDFNGAQDPAKGPCNVGRPRCIATIPTAQRLIAEARAHGVAVIYSVTGTNTAQDIAAALAPAAGDAVVRSGPDKFVGTALDTILAAKGIKTLIVTGTGAEGAVLDTAAHAILSYGMAAIIPVDAMSSMNPYAEQYVAWHLTNAPGVAAKVTLTRSDLIGF